MAIEPNPEFERSVDAIAYQDERGNWRAGPDNSKGQPTGSFISSTYAKQARGLRKWNNDVKRAMRSGEADGFDEGKELVREYRDMKNKLDTGEISESEFSQWVSDTLGS